MVLADEDITKTMNHPMPVRIIRHSSATVVEMEYTRNLKFLGEIYADSSSVGSTIINIQFYEKGVINEVLHIRPSYRS